MTLAPRDRVGWLGVVALGVLALWRIASAGAAAAPTAEEARLADGAYTLLHLPGAPAVAGGLVDVGARVQLTAYAWLTGALDRHDTVIGAGRELAVVAVVVALGALIALARRAGIRPAAAAVALALVVVTPQAASALATFGAGTLGVAWVALGAAVVTGRGRVRALGAIAVLFGVVTAPLIAVPVTIAVVGATARRQAPVAAVALALGSAAVVLVVLSPMPDGATVTGSAVLLVAAGLAVLAAQASPALRLAAAVTTGTVVVVALPWAPAATLVPALVVTTATLVAALANRVAVPARSWSGRAAASAVATAAAAAVIVTGVAALQPSPPAPTHLAMARWITSTTPHSVTIDAPVGIRADLVRDGVAAGRIVPGGTIVVSAGSGPGDALAGFGTGADRLVATGAEPVPEVGAAEVAARASVGRLLAANQNLVAPAPVRDALASGSVDPRALLILAGLAGRGPVLVDDLPVVTGEPPRQARHQVRLRGIDPDTRTWLAGQLPPYAPQVSVATATLTWPVPTTATLTTP